MKPNNSELELNKLPLLSFQTAEFKIKVLRHTLNAVLDTEIIREFVLKSRKDSSDEEFCRACNSKGELILCDSCPAGYHAKCAKIEQEEVEKLESWECPVCEQNKIKSVTDSVNSFEKDSNSFLRQRPLGHDRHGRSYWLIARRLVVLDGESIWYYSTKSQFDQLTDTLDPGLYELPLCKQLDELQGEILEQMTTTYEYPTGLSRTGLPSPPEPVKYLEFIENHEISQSSNDQSPLPNTFETFSEFDKISNFFRAGMEGKFRSYRNFYVDNPLALNRKDINEIKNNERLLYLREYEKQKYIRPEYISRYLWPMDNSYIGGNTSRDVKMVEDVFLSNISQGMITVVEDIKFWFFHPNWKKIATKWRHDVENCKSPIQLARHLEQLELHLRPCFRRTAWFESLGQSYLCRLKDDLRGPEAKRARERSRKQAEMIAEEARLNHMNSLYNNQSIYTRNKTNVLYLRLQNLSKLKGEEYRYNRSYTGWQWHSTCYQSKITLAKDEKNGKIENGRVKLNVNEDKRKLRVGILNGLLGKRTAQVEKQAKEEVKPKVEEIKKEGIGSDLDNLFDEVMEAAEQSERNQEKAETGVKSEPNKPEKNPNESVNETAKIAKIKPESEKKNNITQLRVKKFVSNGKPNIFRYNYGIKRMARTAGVRTNARGYNYTSKSIRQKEVWPYPAPKASFHVWWKYKLSLCEDIPDLGNWIESFYSL